MTILFLVHLPCVPCIPWFANSILFELLLKQIRTTEYTEHTEHEDNLLLKKAAAFYFRGSLHMYQSTQPNSALAISFAFSRSSGLGFQLHLISGSTVSKPASVSSLRSTVLPSPLQP